MGGPGVIDGFLATFTQYIDSGFGLVQGDVRWLASVLIAVDNSSPASSGRWRRTRTCWLG
jgi:type IV secretory pathway TrbL component